MKRKLSLLLAVVMILSLVPMSAFASSDNSVTAIKKVKDDQNLAAIGAPYLKLENDGNDWDDYEIIDLQLTGAFWLEEGDKVVGNVGTDNITDEAFDDFEAALAEEIMETVELADGSDAESITAEVYINTDYRAEIHLTNVDQRDLVVKIPMWVEMDEAEVGQVAVSSKSGNFTRETIVFANASSGATTVSIDDTTTFGAAKEIEPIRIEENAVGAIDLDELDGSYIRLKLDSDFEFIIDDAVISGSLLSGKQNLADIKNLSNDDEELEIYFGGTGDKAGAQLRSTDLGYAGDIVISGLKVKPTKDAKEGKVNITVTSDADEVSKTVLPIGEYADYKVNVTADGEPTEIFSGRYEVELDENSEADLINSTGSTSLTLDEEHELTAVIIDEKVEGSWTKGKPVTIEFPEWVKVIGVDVDSDDDGKEVEAISVSENEFEFQIDTATNNTDKTKVTMTFYVSVEAGKTGDIEAVVGGRGLDAEYKVVLGKVVAPVEVKADVAKIQAGVRDQDLGKVTITEAKEGAILEGKDIVLELDEDMEWDGEPEVNVVAGDLEIDDVEVKDNVLTITVDRESTEPSTIEITEGSVKVDRSIAEGKIDVEVKGDALVQNGYDKEIFDAAKLDVSKSEALEDFGFFSNDYYAKVEVANVITPADSNTKGEPVQFVIDSKTMKVGEVETQMDVAPYIKDGRTMLPVSYVAKAMGVAESNIIWNEATRTVTIFKGTSIVTITIGSNAMSVNGTPVYMDTVAEIKDGRTMLPISFIGAALGADVTWDAATRTVTVK